MNLNSDQSIAFNHVESGKNVFLTGPAGSGKSFLIQYIMEWGDIKGKKIAVTALTGCAALLLGSKAKTLHSWTGVGLAKESAEVLCANILKNPKNKRKWKQTEILIIDEISMMTPCFFEKLDIIGKRVRSSSKPWGGIQLILCGDFFQLPPVQRGSSGISGELSVGKFAFESPVWKTCNLVPIVLSKIERQTDLAFQTLLNECRMGAPSQQSIELMKSRQGLDWKSRFIKPTLLFSRNADVDAINEKNIKALNKPIRTYNARTQIERPPDEPAMEIPFGEALDRIVGKLDNDASYCSNLELCVGAQVMLLINKDMDAGLVNGSRGVVIDFRYDGSPIVQFIKGEPVVIDRQRWTSNDCSGVHREQIPLRVAYAISIHKSQGATLDCALVDIGSTIFEYGQAYVAMSRVRNIESLYIFHLDPSKIMAHPTVIDFYKHIHETVCVESVVNLSTHNFGSELADEGWSTIVENWAKTIPGMKCLTMVAERRAVVPIYPPPEQILSALSVPLSDVKVIILGQDPYHGAGQAHGLSFSVQPGIALPPSLKNIRKELLADLGKGDDIWPANKGTLTPWCTQGVMLLNSILTVEEKNPLSHASFGWEDLTSRLLGAIVCAHADTPLVFIAWGKNAQSVLGKLTLGPKHRILASVHPSPLSAHGGFFGSKPFTKTNAYLEEMGLSPIDWSLHTVIHKPVS